MPALVGDSFLLRIDALATVYTLRVGWATASF